MIYKGYIAENNCKAELCVLALQTRYSLSLTQREKSKIPNIGRSLYYGIATEHSECKLMSDIFLRNIKEDNRTYLSHSVQIFEKRQEEEIAFV